LQALIARYFSAPSSATISAPHSGILRCNSAGFHRFLKQALQVVESIDTQMRDPMFLGVNGRAFKSPGLDQPT
jgi:hypothetical protein